MPTGDFMTGDRIKKDLLSIMDLGEDIEKVLAISTKLKDSRHKADYANLLDSRSMAMIFEKSSTRTR